MSITQEGLETLFRREKHDCLVYGGADNWTNYGDSLEMYRDMNGIDEDEELTWQEKLEALEDGGVDNWPNYGEALDGLLEWKEYAQDLFNQGKDFLSFDDFLEEIYEEY